MVAMNMRRESIGFSSAYPAKTDPIIVLNSAEGLIRKTIIEYIYGVILIKKKIAPLQHRHTFMSS